MVGKTLRTLVSVGFLGVLGWGVYEGRELVRGHERALEDRDERIVELGAEVAAKDARLGEMERQLETLQREVDRLEAARRLLRVDHRIARLSVLDQRPSTERPGGVETDVRFQELDAQGRPLGEPVETTIEGRVAYVDALVMKFDDDFIEQGDVLRGTSVCLFRRLFGEYEWPSQGAPLDGVGQRPLPYGGDDADPGFESRMWERFWDYANDAQAAAAAGVRALHGEAPYMELRTGRDYIVELRASDGLSIRVE